MRNLELLERFRVHFDGYEAGDHGNGAFEVPSPIMSQIRLRVIASDGDGWDHVSVSVEGRCPTWHEMEFIRRLFFQDQETVMQLHPPLADYINHHPYCLHLWRPHAAPLPRPPKWMVGPEP